MRIGIYPGTFDPITNGHLDIIERATKVMDRLIVAIAFNSAKLPLFSPIEREVQVAREIADLDSGSCQVRVQRFDHLLMRFAQEQGAGFVIRGIRAVSDFEYEFQLASMNAALDPNVETLFLPASEGHQFIASSLVKEIARLHGDVSSFVPPRVEADLKQRFKQD